MIFEFDGREFDTEKPICVLGYIILKSWHSFDGRTYKNRNVEEYGAKCKKLYVWSLTFRLRDDEKLKNEVVKIDFVSPDRSIHTRVDANGIIGHSPKECVKIYKERMRP